ncbi:hypothetical protein KIL84_013685 [Mauremys mutica]|uniref:Uncharacterized protein n=1 Tax=Mauremys mutica TaxID=74926 RepID=A0A9D4AUK5_9SAUR|nr:hypothetical protein KIL84_013685 [Mauremys mutica]
MGCWSWGELLAPSHTPLLPLGSEAAPVSRSSLLSCVHPIPSLSPRSQAHPVTSRSRGVFQPNALAPKHPWTLCRPGVGQASLRLPSLLVTVLPFAPNAMELAPALLPASRDLAVPGCSLAAEPVQEGAGKAGRRRVPPL